MNSKLEKALSRFARPAVAAGALALAGASHAAIDIATATAGVSDAQTAVLAILALMVTMSAAVYGLRKVMRLFGR